MAAHVDMQSSRFIYRPCTLSDLRIMSRESTSCRFKNFLNIRHIGGRRNASRRRMNEEEACSEFGDHCRLTYAQRRNGCPVYASQSRDMVAFSVDLDCGGQQLYFEESSPRNCASRTGTAGYDRCFLNNRSRWLGGSSATPGQSAHLSYIPTGEANVRELH
jgi:hypothetical protein